MIDFYTFTSSVLILLGNFTILIMLTEFKYSKKTTAFFISFLYIYCLISSFVGASFFGIEFVKKYCMIITAVPTTIAIYFLSKDNLSKWLFSVILEFNIFYAIMAFIFFIMEKYTVPLLISHVILRIFPYTVFCILFYFFVRKSYKKIEYSNPRGWWVLNSIALGFALLLSYLVTHKIILFKASNDEYLITFAVVIISILTYIGIFRLLKSMHLENQHKVEKQYYALMSKHFDSELQAQEEKLEIARQNRHDLRHHNIVIMEMLKNNNTEQAIEYLSIYQDRLEHFCEKDY